MAENNRLKCQDIPFLIDGVVKIVKSVNKQTTCSDVINKLPNLQCPLAVFESVNGIEKELPGKTKLLKVWRAHGPSSRVVFIVKRSENTVRNRRKSGILAENKKVQSSQSKQKTTRESLKKVADLAFYARYQKTKVQNMKRKLDELERISEEKAQKVMKHFTSSSSVDSMDAFLAKADLEKMSRFLSFCGGVTEEHLGLQKVPEASRDQEVHVAGREPQEDVKKLTKNIIHTSLKNMKLGFKQKFTTKNKATKRTTSVGTISSTDTGYQSVTSEGQGHQVKAQPAGLPKRHTFVDSGLNDVPRHSTPLISRSYAKVERHVEEQDPFNLTTFDEAEGKDAILQKFMADQEKMTKEIDSRASIGCYGFLPESDEHSRTIRFSLPAFKSQKERCRYLWDMYCDSDSDSSSMADDSEVLNTSQLDNAFIDSFDDIPDSDFVTPRNRTLRRESAISNLTKFSLVAKPINFEDDDDSFDYSFNCTFPRMDQSQSVDFTGCFGEDFSHLNENGDNVTFDADGRSDVNVTSELLKDMCDDSFVESDEGLGSMSSGSVQDIVYI